MQSLDAAAIERMPLRWGAQGFVLGDFFRVQSNGVDELVFRHLDPRFIDVGAGMTAGQLRIEGSVGDFVGKGMRGGRLRVEGDTGAFAASEMSGGLLSIGGHAGSHLGAPPPWLAAGMNGGVVVVEGNAADRCGDRMRRGEIFVRGDVGAFCASRMVAGSVTIGGRVGSHLGASMRRGTVMLLGGGAIESPTFVESVDTAQSYFGLLWRSWQRRFAQDPVFGSFSTRSLQQRPSARRFMGDLACGGRGEIFSFDR
jgi:formylmethanofuran dehydrogenase subunit C